MKKVFESQTSELENSAQYSEYNVWFKAKIEKSMADIGTSKNTSGKKNDGKLKPTAAAIKAKSDLGKVKTREATLSKDLVNRLSASMENFPEGTDDD